MRRGTSCAPRRGGSVSPPCSTCARRGAARTTIGLHTPLAFLADLWVALAGIVLWGLGVGVHESIRAAAVATMVPSDRRATAYGLFTAAFGVCWFPLGNVLLGWLTTSPPR